MDYFCTEQERKISHSTCYLEFQRGSFHGECWLIDSISLHIDIFDNLKLYKIFRTAIPDFDYYGITEVNQSQWEILKKLALEQGGEVQKVIEELSIWVSDCFETEKIFTIWGI